jgi:hypothetical protein
MSWDPGESPFVEGYIGFWHEIRLLGFKAISSKVSQIYDGGKASF